MSDLPPIVFLDGHFYYSKDPAPDRHGEVNPLYRDLRVRRSRTEDESVYAALRQLEGHAIRLVVHHHPTPNQERDPFYFEGDGVLHFTLNHAEMSGGWELDEGDNSIIIPIGWQMNGHRGRLMAVPVMSEKTVAKNMANVSVLEDRVQDVAKVLDALRGLGGGDS